jgi:uncharacterized iron-regulated membrane protein
MSEELKPITAGDAGFDTEEPNTRGILVFTGATVVLFIAVLIGVTYYFNNVYERREYEQVLAPQSEQLKELNAREDWELSHYRYVDKAKGQVRIPLNRAMELLVKEAAEGKLKYPTVDQAPKKVEPVQQAGVTQ